MQHSIKILTRFDFAGLLQGYTMMADSVAAKGSEEFRIYNKPFDTVWAAVIEVVNRSKLQKIKPKGKSSHSKVFRH